MERVRMWHPDLAHTRDDPPEVSRRSFEITWRDKGWRLWPPPKQKKRASEED